MVVRDPGRLWQTHALADGRRGLPGGVDDHDELASVYGAAAAPGWRRRPDACRRRRANGASAASVPADKAGSLRSPTAGARRKGGREAGFARGRRRGRGRSSAPPALFRSDRRIFAALSACRATRSGCTLPSCAARHAVQISFPPAAVKASGIDVSVWVDETRPRQQGSQLTAWELGQEGVPHAVIADNAAGHYMAQGQVDICIVGSDRIAANGDVANKIGTYTSALAAAANGVPFYVAAPTTTIAMQTASGAEIPIEERHEDEVLYVWGWSDEGTFIRVRTAPQSSPGRNPAFDVTPAELIAGIITERGIVPATPEGIASVARSAER